MTNITNIRREAPKIERLDHGIRPATASSEQIVQQQHLASIARGAASEAAYDAYFATPRLTPAQVADAVADSVRRAVLKAFAEEVPGCWVIDAASATGDRILKGDARDL